MRFANSVLFCLCFAATASAAEVELVRLSPQNWDEFAPQGKEVDCIYGDYVLRNEHLVAVIADPIPTRNANLTIRRVGGMILDLTRRHDQRDQLSLYRPNALNLRFENPSATRIWVDGKPVANLDLTVSGQEIRWETSTLSKQGLHVVVRYTLRPEWEYLAADTRIDNWRDVDLEIPVSDAFRADRTFQFGIDQNLFWGQDDWFRQAFGVEFAARIPKQAGSRGTVLELVAGSSNREEVPAWGQLRVDRKLYPAADTLQLKGIVAKTNEQPVVPVKIRVEDADGAVPHALLSVKSGDAVYGSGRTDAEGDLECELPPGDYQLAVSGLARNTVKRELKVSPGGSVVLRVELEQAGYVVGNVRSETGGPIPCKIAFHGVEGTKDPDFGPDTGAVAIKNLHYSHNGSFRQAIRPGSYEVIISYGPEYDAVFQTIKVKKGEESRLTASLKRVVDTSGWISSDFHSHSTPSGDNVASQRGRVLNLLCEHVEFCPCTEHNRVDTYVPHLEALQVRHLMATCSGMELTGNPLPVNHQNAFPLIHRPRTQDGGGPTVDANPIVQIERLAMWDSGAEKLVQENHPNLVQIYADRDLNGRADVGFRKMLDYMDVIEVHPPENIFVRPERTDSGQLSRNPMFHWMQLLNLGYRIPGVVNTDAHYNYHESGWIRNYLKSTTDDPAQVDTLEMVRASKAGKVIMSTGPFLEVTGIAGEHSVLPGQDLAAAGGQVKLQVKVQCSNWLDVNRIQVFVNGRASPELNFTRRTHTEMFSNDVIKFERTIPVKLDGDAHLIVAAIGEGLQLGRVMGPRWGEKPPAAVSNPIFVDVDGDGFQPNGDLLDVALPK